MPSMDNGRRDHAMQDQAKNMHAYYGPKGKGWRRSHPKRKFKVFDPKPAGALCREMRQCGNVESTVHGFLAGYGNLFTFWRQEQHERVHPDQWQLFLMWMHLDEIPQDCTTCRHLVSILLSFLKHWREGTLPSRCHPVDDLAFIETGGDVRDAMIKKMIRWVQTNR